MKLMINKWTRRSRRLARRKMKYKLENLLIQREENKLALLKNKIQLEELK